MPCRPSRKELRALLLRYYYIIYELVILLKFKNMEGKKIVKTVDMGGGYVLAKFDDGEIGFLKVITPDGLNDELIELMEGKAEKVETTDASEKSGEKEKEKEKEESQDDDPYTWADLEEMDHKDLAELCKDNDLDTDPADYEEDDKKDMLEFRKEIADEIDVDVPEEEEEDKKPAKDDKYTWDDLVDMDFEELTDLCDEQDLDPDPNDYDEDDEEDKFRRDCATALGIEPPKKKKPRKK